LILADAASFTVVEPRRCLCGAYPAAFGSTGTRAENPNIFRSFPFYNVDLSVTKAYKIRERLSMQFRAEFFNVFNHSNIANTFGGPGGDNTYPILPVISAGFSVCARRLRTLPAPTRCWVLATPARFN
jgi:hypothetical protein